MLGCKKVTHMRYVGRGHNRTRVLIPRVAKTFRPCRPVSANFVWLMLIFSVTRRSRSDVGHSVSKSVSESQLADFRKVTLAREDAAHNSLQMSSSRDLTDVSEDAAHNSLQKLSSWDCGEKSK